MGRLVIENTFYSSKERVLDLLPSVRVIIQRFVAEFPTEASENFLLGESMIGNKHLWVAYDEAEPDKAVLVWFTEIVNNVATERKRGLCIGLCGERLREALPHIVAESEKWAKEREAFDAVIFSRRGWIPMLKDHGYEQTAVVLRREFGDEADEQPE